jgi:hypothetical protein
MGRNERRLDMLEKRARDVVTAKAAREAKRVVGIWNASLRRRSERDGRCNSRRGDVCRILGNVERRFPRAVGAAVARPLKTRELASNS